eukprot:918035_1
MKRQNSSTKTSSLDGVTSTTNSVGDDDGFKRQRQNTSSESGDIVQEQIEAFQQDAEEIKALLQGQQQHQHQASGTEGVNQDDVPLEQQGMGQNGSYLLAPGLIGNRALGNLEPNIDGFAAAGAQNNIVANGDNGRDRPHVILQDGRQGRDLPQSQTNGTVTAINNQNLREMGNGPGHGNSSDDDDDDEADGDNIWLAPRQRRQPRVG